MPDTIENGSDIHAMAANDKQKEMAWRIIDLFSENKSTVRDAKEVLKICYELVEFQGKL